MNRSAHVPHLVVWLGLLVACSPEAPAPVDVDLSGTSNEAAALIENLRRVAAAEPRDADKRGALGLALEANGMPRAAFQTYLEAHDLARDDPRWSYLAAVVVAQLGDLEVALDAVERSLALDDAYVSAHLYRGAWLLDLGRLEDARAAYERASRLMPDNRAAWYGLARVHLRRGDEREALTILENLAAGGTRDPYLQQLLGMAYRETGDLERAGEAAALGRGGKPPVWSDPRRQSLAEYARGFGAEMRRADAYLEVGRWQDAATTLEKLRSSHPTDPDLLTNLALAYRNLGRGDEALQLLELGLEHHPQHVHLLVNLSAVHEQRGEVEQALSYLDRALEHNPELGFVYLRKGRILAMRLGRVEESVAVFEQAVAHDARDPMAHVYLGIALVEMKRWEDAAKRLELALSLDPNRGNAILALAMAYVELGKFDRAETLLDRLEQQSRGVPQVAELRERIAHQREDAR